VSQHNSLDEKGIRQGGLLDAARQADGLTASIAKSREAHQQAKEEELAELRRKKANNYIIRVRDK
jgi:hypothetical protein